MEQINFNNLVPITEFFLGFWAGKYSFSGNQWMYNTDDEYGEAKGFEKMVKGFEDTHGGKLYFEVDPEDNTSDTLVLERKIYVRHISSLCELMTEFFEEFGTGDEISIQENHGHVYVRLWYD